MKSADRMMPRGFWMSEQTPTTPNVARGPLMQPPHHQMFTYKSVSFVYATLLTVIHR